MPEFRISPYPFTLLLSIISGFAVAGRLMSKQGIKGRIIIYQLLLNMALCIYCSKLYTVVVSGFRVGILEAGTSSLGAAIGLLAGCLVMGRIVPSVMGHLLRAYIVALPLMYGISKIGCFLVGCCHGIAYEGFGAVSYHNSIVETGLVFPVQLLESVLFLLIFLFGIWYFHRAAGERVLPLMLLLCAVGKFFPDFLRMEHVRGHLSPNQWVCIGFAILGAVLLALDNKELQAKRNRS